MYVLLALAALVGYYGARGGGGDGDGGKDEEIAASDELVVSGMTDPYAQRTVSRVKPRKIRHKLHYFRDRAKFRGDAERKRHADAHLDTRINHFANSHTHALPDGSLLVANGIESVQEVLARTEDYACQEV